MNSYEKYVCTYVCMQSEASRHQTDRRSPYSGERASENARSLPASPHDTRTKRRELRRKDDLMKTRLWFFVYIRRPTWRKNLGDIE